MGILYDSVKRREDKKRKKPAYGRTDTEIMRIVCADEMSPFSEQQFDMMLEKVKKKGDQP